MARGLLTRIIVHGLERGYWQPGSIVGDPFGGIGTTGIIGAYYGLRVVMVELEERFCALWEQNADLHRAKWKVLGAFEPVMTRGDSRHFAEIVGPLAGAVTSPPFLATEGGCKPKMGGTIDAGMMSRHNATADVRYGSSPGQIGALPAGKLDGAITSPPYSESLNNGGQVQGASVQRARAGRTQDSVKYGTTEGQIGRCPAGEKT